MVCSCFLDPYCVSGSCPTALYHEYGPDYGFLLSCKDCDFSGGCCERCLFEFSDVCPLDYLLAEAVPAFGE